MGHEIFERFLFHRFPDTGDGKNKASVTYRIGPVPDFDHAHVGLGAIGGIPAHNHQLGPTRWHKLADHLSKQGIFVAIPDMVFVQDEAKASWHTIPVPRRNLIEPWWKVLRSLARKARRFETWKQVCQAIEAATACWNAHRHPFIWGGIAVLPKAA
jgi:hypothetical protein